jgi:hypothetical protein
MWGYRSKDGIKRNDSTLLQGVNKATFDYFLRNLSYISLTEKIFKAQTVASRPGTRYTGSEHLF